ncbi:glycosyltransferase [Macrococcus sp. DPC7161]|uniref:glycosyltransferase n=1 Tax=Macrococcus sp. DPC7161 TaxID=2507060 RepID=UPI00100A3B70|nr:glycosyltransferase [Macrococcus sp. DPC7161]RXK18812.1 glycosyltransferase family 1 protein [Macrococcus sp. DPC7161]
MSKQRILVSGYINTNVLDGSAIFISSLTQVLAMHPNATIDLLLAVPYERDIVLGDLIKLDNVNIIDPFVDERFTSFSFLDKNKLTKQQYAELILHSNELEKYDAIFIRSLEVVDAMLQKSQAIASKLYAYITGITSDQQLLSEQEIELLSNVTNNSGYLLCQTLEMKNHILKQTNIDSNHIIDLNPMIPNQTLSFNDLFKEKKAYDTFCYTGKFAYEWNIIEMITQFREVVEKHPNAKLYIAGDQFKNTDKNEMFVANAKYLIEHSKNVYWLGGLPRQDTLNLIRQCDIGLTYRHEDLSDSLELSTKLLEYCSLGVPPILNRTEMHERIFGKDYPYFANDDASFYNVLNLIIESPQQYQEIAEKVFKIAGQYSFNATFIRLMPFINKNNDNHSDIYNLISKADNTQPLIYDENQQIYALLINENYLMNLKEITQVHDIQNVNVIGDHAIITVSNNNSMKMNVLDVVYKIEQQKKITYKEDPKQFSLDKVQRQFNKVDINVEKLVKENQRLRKDVKRLREKYNNLSNSKLGALQKKYWLHKKNKSFQ